MLKETVMPVDKFGECGGGTGPMGPAGPAGVTGPAGATGPVGVTGPQGKRGIEGSDGPPGKKGSDGSKGDVGKDGKVGPKGDIGPVGQKGEDAFNLIQWAPHAIKRLFRESEAVNIYFNNATDGIIFKESKPIGLKNRGLEGDAKFIGENFPSLLRIKNNRYMIELKNSIFEIKPITCATTSPSTAIFALSFKSLSISEEPRILFSNGTGTRAISLKDRSVQGSYVGVLTIYSSGVQKELLFNNREWMGLLIQYTCIHDNVYCQYMLNEVIGTLDMGSQDEREDHTLYIGGHPKKSKAHHAMGSFEMYETDSEEGDYKLSEEMQTCLIRDILDRVDGDESRV